MEEIYERLTEIKNRLFLFTEKNKSNECFLDKCTNSSIKSHTLSVSRVLGILKDKNGSVYHLEDNAEIDYENLTLSTFQKSKRSLSKKSIYESSVFYGFCSKHDNDIFEVIDNNGYINNDKINFLHSLRCFAYYTTQLNSSLLYILENVIPNLESVAQDLKTKIPSNVQTAYGLIENLPDSYQINWKEVESLGKRIDDLSNANPINREQQRETMRLRMSSLLQKDKFPMSGILFKLEMKEILNQAKSVNIDPKLIDIIDFVTKSVLDENNLINSKMNNAYNYKKFESLTYLPFSLSGIYPLAGSFVFSVIEVEDCPISLTFFPELEKNKTQFIFGALESSKAQQRFFSHINIMSEQDFTQFVSMVILNQGTNVYFSSRYWVKLRKEDQDIVVERKKDMNDTTQIFNMFDRKFCD